MTRGASQVLAVLGALAGGCVTTDDHYDIDLYAEVHPLGAAGAQFGGQFEVLAPARGENPDFSHTIAAFHVTLPPGAAPWVRLWMMPSCESQGGQAQLYKDLGVIRQVGDEVHFFERDVVLSGHTTDLDIGTVAAPVTVELAELHAEYPVVIQAPDPDGPTTTSSFGETVPVGGPWLACGNFVRAATQ